MLGYESLMITGIVFILIYHNMLINRDISPTGYTVE